MQLASTAGLLLSPKLFVTSGADGTWLSVKMQALCQGGHFASATGPRRQPLLGDGMEGLELRAVDGASTAERVHARLISRPLKYASLRRFNDCVVCWIIWSMVLLAVANLVKPSQARRPSSEFLKCLGLRCCGRSPKGDSSAVRFWGTTGTINPRCVGLLVLHRKLQCEALPRKSRRTMKNTW